MTDALKEKVLKNIIQECYWDYNIDEKNLENILNSGNKRDMKKVFSKIIYNSKDKLLSLRIFSNQDLKDFFQDFKVTYNEKYISKHILILRTLLFNENNNIKSLEWKKI